MDTKNTNLVADVEDLLPVDFRQMQSSVQMQDVNFNFTFSLQRQLNRIQLNLRGRKSLTASNTIVGLLLWNHWTDFDETSQKARSLFLE